MAQVVFQQDKLVETLNDLIGADGALEDAKLALFVEAEPITPDKILADLTEADYSGYARSAAVVYGTPHLTEGGNAVVQVTPHEFKATSSVITNTVTHVGLLNAAGTALIASYELPEPLVFNSVHSVHMIGFPLTLSQPSEESEEVVP